jgi:hypothetical protein
LIARGRDAAGVAISTTFGANILKRFVVRTDEVTSEDEPAVRLAYAVEANVGVHVVQSGEALGKKMSRARGSGSRPVVQQDGALNGDELVQDST